MKEQNNCKVVHSDKMVGYNTQVWECTSELRWSVVQNTNERGEKLAGSATNTLQQKWVSNTGEVEWRGIPEVNVVGDGTKQKLI